MIRKILGVVAGVVAGGLVVFAVEAVGHAVFPPPPGLDTSDPETMKTMMQSLPVGALLCVVVAWVLGAFAGGAVAALVGRSLGPALVTGALQLLFGIVTMVMIPHPLWMIALGIVLPLPAAWAGGTLVRRS
jgi:hypothetical protein